MKRALRLNLVLSLTACVVLSVLLGSALVCAWPVGLIVLLCSGIIASLWAIWHLAMGVLYSASSFAKALEMKDYTIRFPKSSDIMVDRLHSSMNNIVALQRDGSNALETRKLYYDRILRIMTHELRNAITPIISIADDMRQHPERYQGENLTEAASLVSDESTSIKHFLDSYYELTHLPKPHIVSVEAKSIFEQINRNIQLIIKEEGIEGVSVHYIIAEGMTLDIDADLMKRAIINLLKNACEATAGRPNATVELTATMPQGKPYITITDNGPGMPTAVLDNLFQPFFTTKPGGNGIGLCLSRQIVRLHGGEITAATTPSGSTFTIALER